ncbi:unnamed protein product (macronuclear) [Paramecium tetraurelia]|uniref:U1-type domain-containing protein n=1 Tax=Paramecium tetraurelia TaxID=5888 RepID=A0CKE1_PARTE|nr:uncharacterized protein GSPATT00000971001 [Paramecium tetraurelia]CAK71258.1 unnamed protein product [Paramecium tetraurelia]|eukprot:XP_001438655.1 hypothetical protein (macronuclear) [Paramecium tetraurelia strain d4-2]
MADQNIPIYRRGVEEVVKKSVDEYGKQKWDIEHKIFDKQEREDEEYDKNNPRYTKSLQARTDSVGIDESIGKKRNVVKEGLKKDQSGFYCELCDELATDSLSWLDHLNSIMHNRLLGMNMKVDKVTALDVKEKLQQIKESTTKSQVQAQEKPKSIEEIRRQLEEQLQKKKEKKLKKQTSKLQSAITKNNEQEIDEDDLKLKQFLKK